MILSLSAAVGTIVSVAVGVLAVGIVVFTLIYSYVRKKQGKSGCDCRLRLLFVQIGVSLEREKAGRQT